MFLAAEPFPQLQTELTRLQKPLLSVCVFYVVPIIFLNYLIYTDLWIWGLKNSE